MPGAGRKALLAACLEFSRGNSGGQCGAPAARRLKFVDLNLEHTRQRQKHNLASWALRADSDSFLTAGTLSPSTVRKRRISRGDSLLGGITWRVTARRAYSNVWAVAGGIILHRTASWGVEHAPYLTGESIENDQNSRWVAQGIICFKARVRGAAWQEGRIAYDS